MSNSNPGADPTFRSYSAAQAAAYAAGRKSYSNELYATIFEYHASGSDSFQRLLDVGCGPGNATRDVAVAFDHAVGTDAGAAMIEAAKSIGGNARLSPIRYEVSPAEECDALPGLAPESVDMITVAMAVHWFELDRFYKNAAKLLKPGGSLIMWCHGSLFPHPSTPNYEKVKEILLDFEINILGPHVIKGNRYCMNLYTDLPMPWDLNPPMQAFDEDSVMRRYWNKNGECAIDQEFFSGKHVDTFETFGKAMGTASMVTRWREAHPEATGDDDCVAVLIKRMRDAMGPGIETISTGSTTVVVGLRKASL